GPAFGVRPPAAATLRGQRRMRETVSGWLASHVDCLRATFLIRAAGPFVEKGLSPALVVAWRLPANNHRTSCVKSRPSRHPISSVTRITDAGLTTPASTLPGSLLFRGRNGR